MTTPTAPLPPDALVNGRYRVVRLIGRGGMGAVYEAVDTRLGNTVALKQTMVRSAQLDEAFEREARVLAALRHPALPVVSDYFTEGDGQFLVMQFIPGSDLASLLRERGRPFSFYEVRPWAEQLLDALDYLHSQSPPIVHRDIKPQNLKLTPRGEVILLDFGLAKGGQAAQEATNPGPSLYGYTPQYAPMEQIRGTGTDPRSDLYSLAATLYALLTNTPPASALDRAAAAVHAQPDPLRPAYTITPDVPREVSDLLDRCLALRQEDRPATAAIARDSLRGQVRLEASSAGAPTILQRPTPPPLALPTPPTPPAGGGPHPLLLLSVLAGLIFLVAVAGMAGLASLINSGGSSAAADVEQPTPIVEADPPTAISIPTIPPIPTIELPNVAATIGAVQTEVAEQVGNIPGIPAPNPNSPQPALQFGQEGTGDGFLDDPRGVAIGPEGEIYVSDYGNGRVQRFSATGNFERRWVLPEEDPLPIRGLAADRRGRVYVVQNRETTVYDGASGELIGRLEGSYDELLILGDGGMLAIEDADIVRLDAEGREVGRLVDPIGNLADADGAPGDIAADGLGTIYVLESSGEYVYIFAPDGAYRDRFSVPDPNGFTGLALDGQGRIYVGTFWNKIQVFDKDGRPLDQIDLAGSPRDLMFDTANNLYVVTSEPGVLKFSIAPAPQ